MNIVQTKVFLGKQSAVHTETKRESRITLAVHPKSRKNI